MDGWTDGRIGLAFVVYKTIQRSPCGEFAKSMLLQHTYS